MENTSIKECDENATSEDDTMSKDTTCGLRSWRPTCLQYLANRTVYMTIFVTGGIIRSMTFAYFNGIITTIEKVFGISSGLMGFLLSGNDIAQMLCGMLVTHYGGKGSRPLWIGVGMVFSGASYFIYGSCQLFWDQSMNYTYRTGFNKSSTSTSMLGMCSTSPENEETYENNVATCDLQHSNVIPIVLIFIGQLIFGAGGIALYSLGFTYVDDNVKKRDSALYIGLSNALRSIGPTIGYLLASVCLQIYINPNEKPDYGTEDPRWLGAWWLGFLIMAVMQLSLSIPMLLFPRHLPSKRKLVPINNIKAEERLECQTNTSSKEDFIPSFVRLARNPIVIFHLLAMIPPRFGLSGFSTFMPKYLEAEFGQSASSASVFTGISSKLMMMVGIFAGGFVIWKFKPRTVYINSWNAFVKIVFAISILIAMMLDCNDHKFDGIGVDNNRLQVTSTCSQNCNCELKFDPVCVTGQKNFFSPCLAGCTGLNQTVGSPKVFYNCGCGSSEWNNGPETLTATPGYCPNTRGTCNLFYVYIALFGVSRLIASTSIVGNLAVIIRSVEKRDKSLILALRLTIMCLFGFIPGQIIFGTMADSTCLLWKTTTCGKRGNCSYYNFDQLRYLFHGVTAACYIISFAFEVLVCIYSRHINLYEEEDSSEMSNKFQNKKNLELMECKTEETKIT